MSFGIIVSCFLLLLNNLFYIVNSINYLHSMNYNSYYELR
jgi:hypothetical protein